MTQQEAQNLFNEKMIEFQRTTEFPDGGRFINLLEHYRTALRWSSPRSLKLTVDEYFNTASLPSNSQWMLRQTGIILQIIEAATPHQLDLDLFTYLTVQKVVAQLNEEWIAIVEPQAMIINAEIQTKAAAEKEEAEIAKGKTQSGYTNKVFAPASPKAEA